MTPLDQASAILKAAEDIGALDQMPSLGDCTAAYDAAKKANARAALFGTPEEAEIARKAEAVCAKDLWAAWEKQSQLARHAPALALALIEKHRALEAAEARLAQLESVLAEAGEVIDQAIPELQKWEFVESKTYSYGDGRTEPLEWGIDVQYQQQKPHDTPEYMFRADVQIFQANADLEEWDSLSRRAASVSNQIAGMKEKGE